MIYDRPYMKSVSEPSFRKNSVLKLIGLNLGLFIIDKLFAVLFNQPNVFANVFAFSSTHFLQGQLWTILSYSFLHSSESLLHIFRKYAWLIFHWSSN